RPERLDALSAAFLNAASANVLDFCDTHVLTVIHPTAPVAPSLFALGELRRVSGRDLILALVLGAEIECRIGLAISPSHYRRGWPVTPPRGASRAAPPPQQAAKFSRSNLSRWSPPLASPRPKPQVCANASARRPKAFISATPRATVCGRRYWPPHRRPGLLPRACGDAAAFDSYRWA